VVKATVPREGAREGRAWAKLGTSTCQAQSPRRCGTGPDTLRADPGRAGCASAEAVVYWASGPFPGPTCRSGGAHPPYPRGWRGPLASRVPRRARWTWLPVAACTCGATPHGPAAVDALASTPGSASCGGLRRTYSPSTGNCQQHCDLRTFTKSAGQCGPAGSPATRRRRARAHRSAASGGPRGHPFGRSWTVRPPTTVRSATGRSRPGVRSGSPGTPERGSVDQLATRSSGAWTTRSPTLQTA
jgi:hypothetical protein